MKIRPLYHIYYCLALLSLLLPFVGRSQDLSQIGKGKALKIKGGISANSMFYGGNSSRDPFSWYLNGNINCNVYGINAPFTFSYSNRTFGYSQPFKFNRLSLHPSYKWARLHMGDISMSFSPYTLNGYQFTGGGVDLTPSGPFKISAMYGRLLKAVEYNPDVEEISPSYARLGYGIKTSYEESGFSVGLIIFKAYDQENSISEAIPDDLEISPQDNLVVSLSTAIQLLSSAQLTIEYSTSGLTRNTNATKDGAGRNWLAMLMNQKSSTDYYNALKASFNYRLGKSSLGLSYERVDPGYETLGAYYFNNDLENIAGNMGYSFFQGKLALLLNVGVQRNDLENTSSSKMRQLVSSANITYAASDKLNIAASYSNFQTFMHLKNQFDYINANSPYENLDTLNFTQLSQSATINVSYRMNESRNIVCSLSVQDAADKNGDVVLAGNSSQFYNSNLSYSQAIKPKDINLSAGISSSYNTIGGSNTLTIGPMVAINKSFLEKKLNTRLNCSFNYSSANGERQASVSNIRWGGTYRMGKKHNFNLNLMLQHRDLATQGKTDNITAMLGYNYNF